MWLFIVIITLIVIGAIIIFYFTEKNDYNNGECYCGGKLKYFTTDSQGNEGYCCSKCGRTIWVGWYKPKNYMR